MLDARYNLLTDPLIRVQLDDGDRRVLTLPEVLAQLSHGEISSFSGLRPHQTHAWHAFLVQLGAIALEKGGLEQPPTDPAPWTSLLLELTEGSEAPWCLVVEDPQFPAFLQPPVPEGSLSSFNKRLETPDALDVLITAKNHDLKAQRITRSLPEHWLYALLTLQTMEGFLGAGNYGIARMNGGFASRPAVSVVPGQRLGERFRRDLEVLQEALPELHSRGLYAPDGGLALIWLEPWDGTTSLPLDRCHPYFIEICRRVRLVESDGMITALAVPTKTRRLQADDLKGNTGDPWTPVDRSEGKALTVQGAGFTYTLFYDLLLTGDYQEGAAQRIRPGDGEGSEIMGWVLVRGQGKTEGLHERRIPLPAAARLRLSNPQSRSEVGLLARKWLDATATMSEKVLKPALCSLLQAGSDGLDFKDDRPSKWLNIFEEQVDQVFFETLWQALELTPSEADRRWEKRLLSFARQTLNDAIRSAPLPSSRYYRAISAAERLFGALVSKNFPELMAGKA